MIQMGEYSPEPKPSGRRVKVELDISIYTTRADLKDAEGVDISRVAEKFNLASSRHNADKLNIDKLKNVPNVLKGKLDKLNADKLVPVLK